MPAEIDALLLTWARWACYRIDAGLGYAPTTTLGRVIELGPAAAASRQAYSSGSIPSNEVAEHIDRLVAALPEKFKVVIRIEYLGRESRKQKAKRLHLSYDAFYGRLKMAKRLLAAGIG